MNLVPTSLLLVAVVLCSTACQTSDDPREGGFIGGVQGLSSGRYEQRIQEREERLKRLQEMQRELETERTGLEEDQQEHLSAYQAEQEKLRDLSRQMQSLRGKLNALNTQHIDQERTRKGVLQKLDGLQQKLDQLAAQDSDGASLQEMTDERDALEEEYRLLLDVYREISQ